MIKKINLHTDPNGLKMLRTKCVPILSITDDIKELINDLAETCTADPNCAGLSSNQIWTNIIEPPPAVFVLKTQDRFVLPFINPVLKKAFKKTDIFEEGCMSMPSCSYKVERPKHIIVSFMEANNGELQNDVHLYYGVARIWQHEYDHIQGRLISDYY